ncbi:MAG: AAA family ATPase [Rudanella sp.]|nr:AAA family ATPase [Rudanella sp.]
MYIRRIEINNIRSIEHFEMTFPEGKEAGWHVLIGDNGSGKSTIVRAVALGLLDYKDIIAIGANGQNWDDWLSVKTPVGGTGSISVEVSHQDHIKSPTLNRIYFDRQYYGNQARADLLEVLFRGRRSFSRQVPLLPGTLSITIPATITNYPPPTPTPAPPPSSEDWFSTAYGPFRRFTGGNTDKERLYQSNPKLGAHLSVFGEDVALSEALSFLMSLYIKQIDDRFNHRPEDKTFEHFTDFINSSDLLPNETHIESVSVRDGIFFKDSQGNKVTINQMSDGYRSILSMTFELIRQLIQSFGTHKVFEYTDCANPVIGLPGVVLIDEVDSHLHPTWQDAIGEWFTTYFPNIQFIVTTHSPLICRAAEKGSIWRLATPGSGEQSEEVIGTDRDRLIYGNILDAYGTGTFGEEIERSDESHKKLARLTRLNQLNRYVKISDEEKKERAELSKIFNTDDSLAE